MNLFKKYLLIAMGINGLFKLINTYNVTVTRSFNKETDMLIVEKFTIILVHLLIGPILMPFTLYNNLVLMELYVKNKDINDYHLFYDEYNKNNKLIDHFIKIY